MTYWELSWVFKKKSSLIPLTFKTYLKKELNIVPKNEYWYLQAITHSSYKNKYPELKDNERLEYLGDAFISLIVAQYLFELLPNEQEGILTQLRAKIVSRDNLNKLGKKIHLDNHLLYQKSKNTYKSLIGNAFEALFGAILLDCGYNAAKKIFINQVLNKWIDLEEIKTENRDFKSELLIHFQKQKEIIHFNVKERLKTNKNVRFEASIKLNDKVIGVGLGPSKKEAEQQAAKNVFNQL